ncbi:hypothetical protein HS1genome_1921 [Sulfodiicoccus acidiphilus]|uniref:Glycosyltransferase 2-like domain-containing protein n=1 Tax=Sulfodiicoccus acidiphilus TaxID=1670455 RepID=A0A348B5T0_9CREN|nr:hypothetical protein HS1genome_1921 [Sulfodiicoccus acidiphilus]
MLTVVVPAYNEGERIRETLSQLTSSLRDVEVIVVFDGDDHTPDVVRNYPVKLVVSKERLGKGER